MKNRWIENKCPMVSNLILISFSHNHPESYHDFPNVSSQPAGGFLSHRGTSSHHPYFNGIFHYEPSILGTPMTMETPIFTLIPFRHWVHHEPFWIIGENGGWCYSTTASIISNLFQSVSHMVPIMFPCFSINVNMVFP